MKDYKVYKVQQGYRLDIVTIEKLKVIAMKKNRSLNNLVETVLKDYIVDFEEKHGKIEIDEE